MMDEPFDNHETAALERLEDFLNVMRHLDAKGSEQHYQILLQQAKRVRIHSYSDLPECISDAINDRLKTWWPKKKECYRNASILTVELGDLGVEYCEGLAPSLIAVDHAWNVYQGMYFDLTAELALRTNQRHARDLNAYFGRVALHYVTANLVDVMYWQLSLVETPWLSYTHYKLLQQRGKDDHWREARMF